MGTDVCFLVTLLNGDSLLRCAVKVNRSEVSMGCLDYPMEYRNIIAGWLPLHVRSVGPIVEVETIFAVHCHEQES